MKGKYKVTISKRAENNLDEIINYLDQEWGKKVKDNFLGKLIKIQNLLSTNPFLFVDYSKNMKIHRCLVTKHNFLYYKIIKNEVQIITIHDTRRNPKIFKL
jgi:hypothetical protein